MIAIIRMFIHHKGSMQHYDDLNQWTLSSNCVAKDCHVAQCMTLTFAERFRLAVSLGGNKPLSAK